MVDDYNEYFSSFLQDLNITKRRHNFELYLLNKKPFYKHGLNHIRT